MAPPSPPLGMPGRVDQAALSVRVELVSRTLPAPLAMAPPRGKEKAWMAAFPVNVQSGMVTGPPVLQRAPPAAPPKLPGPGSPAPLPEKVVPKMVRLAPALSTAPPESDALLSAKVLLRMRPVWPKKWT